MKNRLVERTGRIIFMPSCSRTILLVLRAHTCCIAYTAHCNACNTMYVIREMTLSNSIETFCARNVYFYAMRETTIFLHDEEAIVFLGNPITCFKLLIYFRNVRYSKFKLPIRFSLNKLVFYTRKI